MNIKGHVGIDLKDVRTGRTEHREGDNMVTNALEYFYEQGGLSNPAAFNVSNVRNDALNYLLGGVLCFDTALQESADLIRVPAGVGMTANGARGVLNSGDPAELGSWNENESGWAPDGSFKMVFDWTQSQGNGTIASVSLSSLYGGYRGAGNKSLTSKTNAYNMGHYNSINAFESHAGMIPLGWYNNRFIYAEIPADSETWTFYAFGYPLTEIDIRDATIQRSVSENQITAPAVLDNSYLIYGRMISKQFGKYAYLMAARARTSGSYYTRHFTFLDSPPTYVFKIDLDTLAVVNTQQLTPTTTGIEEFTLADNVYPTMIATDQFYVFSKYIINAANLVDVKEITNFAEDTTLTAIGSDIAEGNGQRVNLNTGIALPVNPSNSNLYSSNYDKRLLGVNSSYVYRDPRYLATIFNLATPVTKTADKTMKVTYVLRFTN